jgi:acetylornithine/succinyldiaminopimelate/putrescine aminotransferase
LIFDEVQTGMGRTGTLFAYEQEGVVPDIMTLAKALANGFPVGAMLARAETAASFTPGSHASTFGGNPLAMAAALATLEVLGADAFLARCLALGERLREGLRSLQARFPQIREVRGRGLIVGAELEGEGGPVVQACLERGLLINCTNGTILRFVPPLVIGEAEIDEAVAILATALAAVYNQASPPA